MKHTILFHDQCADGFGAAFAAWLHFRYTASYIPVQYGKEPPDLEPCDHLFILDFSYPLNTLIQLREKAKRITIVDHHKTAKDDLEFLSRIDSVIERPETEGIAAEFNMNESGATLAWELFHLDKQRPLFFDYLKDRDLWQWKLEKSREFSAGLSSYPFSFETWLNFLHHPLMNLMSDGAAILRAQQQRIERMCQTPEWITLKGHHVPCVNATSDMSEVGEYLCTKYPTAPFSASFFVTETNVVWSLRSRHGFDVSAVAKELGGGGHPGAAGFKQGLEFLSTIVGRWPRIKSIISNKD